MCGSTNKARSAAFAAAAAFLAVNASKTIGTEVPKGKTRSQIEFIQSLNGGKLGEPPVSITALADAEDAVLAAVREVQIAQAEIFATLLGGEGYNGVYGDSAVTERLVAAVNNLKTADEAETAARVAVDAEGEAAQAELDAQFGASDANPILQ